MNQLIAYLHSNPLMVLALYAAFNLFVDTMPEPKPNGGNGYLWLYKFLHAAAMNIKTARGLKMMIPQAAPDPNQKP